MINDGERFESTAEKTKRKYSPPSLIHYGSVSELTQGGESIGNDGNTECNGNAPATNECVYS